MQSVFICLVLVLQLVSAQLNLCGNATRIPNGDGSSYVSLTRATGCVGGAYMNNQFRISDGGVYINDGFVANFKIRAWNGSNPYVADGIAFVMHSLNNPLALGGGGGNMGVPPGSTNAVHGFRFDWYTSGQAGMVVLESFQDNNWNGDIFNRSTTDTTWHSVKVEYQQSTQTIAINVDGKDTGTAVFQADMYPSPQTANWVWVGITAATGGFWMNYDTDDSLTIMAKPMPRLLLYGVAQSIIDPDLTTSYKLVQYDNSLVGGAFLPTPFTIAQNGVRANDGFVATFRVRVYRQVGVDKLADGFTFLLYNSTVPGVDPDGGGWQMGVPQFGTTGFKFDWWNTVNNVVWKWSNDTIIRTLDLPIASSLNWRYFTIAYTHRTGSIFLNITDVGATTTTWVYTIYGNLYPDTSVSTVWTGVTASTGGVRMTMELHDDIQVVGFGTGDLVVTPQSNKKSNSKAIGLGVGIPLGLIALALIVVGVLFLVRKGGVDFKRAIPSRFSRQDDTANSTTEAALNKL